MAAIASVAAQKPYPLRVAGLVDWYDSASTYTITEASGVVSAIASKSGLLSSLTPTGGAGTEPITGTRTQNSLNVIDFDGTDDYLQRGSSNGIAQPYTMFLVAKNDDGADATSQTAVTGSGSAASILKSSSNFWAMSDGTQRTSTIGPPDVSYHIFTKFANGSTCQMKVDGTEVIATGSTVGTNAPTTVRVGRVAAAGSTYWDGTVGEVLLYSGTLSAGDTALIESYLASKWAIPIRTPAKVADRGTGAGTQGAQNSNTITMTTAGSITVGNYLIACVVANNANTAGAAVALTMSDARSGAWTVLGPANQTPGAATNDGMSAWICYVKTTAAYTNNDNVTFNWSPGSTGQAAIIGEYSGIHATSPVAVTAVTANGASTTPSVAIVPTTINQLVVGCLGVEGLDADTYTADSDTTLGSWANLTRASVDAGGVASSSIRVEGAYKVVTGGGTQTWNQTITSRDWASIAVVFGNA